MKKIAAFVVSVALATVAIMAVAVVERGPSAEASSTSYSCFSGTPAPQQLTNRSDPRKCRGVYKIWQGGRYVVTIDNRRVKNWSDLGRRLQQGYTASQKWCASNSLTCTIVTTAGFLALRGVWAVATA